MIKKLQTDGWLVWYSPEAWLYHRVPNSRATISYLRRRAFNQGISSSFLAYRNDPSGRLKLLGNSLLTLLEAILRKGYSMLTRRPGARVGRDLAAAASAGKGFHMMRLALDSSLRHHVLRTHYMDDNAMSKTIGTPYSQDLLGGDFG